MWVRLQYLIGLLAVILPVSALEECFQPKLCNKIDMSMDLQSDDNDISLTWSYNSSETFYGFQVKIFDSENQVTYESPILHIRTRSMNFVTELPSGKNRVCLQILSNYTHTITQTCDNLKMSDMKMVVGILAGVVFLVPCLIILAVFIYKDKQVRNSAYQKLMTGYGNETFTSGEEEPTGHKLTYTIKHKPVHAKPIMELVIENPQTDRATGITPNLETDKPAVHNVDETMPNLEANKSVEEKADQITPNLETNNPVEQNVDITAPNMEANKSAGENADKITPDQETDTPVEQNLDNANPNQEATKPAEHKADKSTSNLEVEVMATTDESPTVEESEDIAEKPSTDGANTCTDLVIHL